MTRKRRGGARLALTLLTVFAIVSVFVVRLVDIQVVRADALSADALDKRSVPLVTNGVRGDIVDTNGVVLAGSVDRFDITASPRVALGVRHREAVAQAIVDIARLTAQDPSALLLALSADPTSDFTYLAQGVTLEIYRAVRDLEIPWVYFELRPSRTYPNGAVAGNLVGFVGTDGPQAGLELTGNECLAGADGVATYQMGEDGVRIPGSLVTEEAARDGGTLRLTIDRDLQYSVQQQIAKRAAELGATWATVVVVRVKDGHLMAVADYPSVDPNHVDGVPTTALGSLAFSTPYEPGSTFKALTAASLLDAGVASPTTQVIAPNRRYLADGGYIKDAWSHGDLRYTMAGALMNSSNTGISALTDLLDAQSRYDYMVKFGVGEATAVGFNGESAGVLRPPSEWDERTNYSVQFGQGVSATSAQVASVFQTLGNGGVRMPLTLVDGCEWADGTVTHQTTAEGTRVVSEQAADTTVNMLEKVVSDGLNRAALTIPNYRVAVKTGTGEVAANGVYTDARVISMAGLAPAEDPEYAVIVTAGIPGSMFISSALATTFRDIMTQVLKTFRVPPSTEPAPSIPLTW